LPAYAGIRVSDAAQGSMDRSDHAVVASRLGQPRVRSGDELFKPLSIRFQPTVRQAG
jgi:hypothetical protein